MFDQFNYTNSSKRRCGGETQTRHGPQANLKCDKSGKHFRTMDVKPTPYLRTASLKQLAGATKAPEGGPTISIFIWEVEKLMRLSI